MKHWTPSEENTLRREYGITPTDELARKLGRTESAINKAVSARRISADRNRWSVFGKPDPKRDRHKDKHKHAADCLARYYRDKQNQRKASAGYRQRNYRKSEAA